MYSKTHHIKRASQGRTPSKRGNIIKYILQTYNLKEFSGEHAPVHLISVQQYHIYLLKY